MAIRVLLMIFITLQPNVLVNYAFSRCVMKNTLSVECESVLELSDRYFNESLDNVQDVKRLFVSNNSSELIIHYSAFRYFSDLEVVIIQFSQIRKIFQDTFKDLPVKSVSISYNGIEQIYPGALRNLPLLQKFSASHNRLKIIPRGIFKDLPSLNSLTLSNNKISSIENSAFENLPRLTKLQLDNNNIDTIFIHNIVSHPEKLEILWLHNNSLTFVTNFMLQKLTNLKLLNLGFNKISIIEVNAFEQTPQLRTLVLTHNQLKEIDGSIFPRKGLDHLKKLYLDNNELMFLPSSFFFRLNNLMKVTLVGNPWDCSCLDVINRILMENGIEEKCNDKYVAGDRPVCVNSDAASKVCSYIYDSKSRDIYMNHKKTFPLYSSPLKCHL